jgi:hypothetical protein
MLALQLALVSFVFNLLLYAIQRFVEAVQQLLHELVSIFLLPVQK